MDNRELIFCKRCGAISPKGICGVCGYDNSEIVEENAGGESNINDYSESDVRGVDTPVNQPPAKKKSKTAVIFTVIGIVSAAFILLLIVGVTAALVTGVIFTPAPITATPKISPIPSAPVVGFEVKGIARAAQEEDIKKVTSEWMQNNTDSMITQDAGSYDYFANGHGSSSFCYGHNLMGREDIQKAEYFDPFYDSFDDSCGYSVKRHYTQVTGTLNGNEYDGRFGYYSIEGENIPNIDTINSYLENRIYYDYYKNIEDDLNFGCCATIEEDSYITYNDEKILSVVYTMNLRVQNNTNDYKDHYIYGVNIDLVNGKIMDNSKIVKIDDAFVTEFRRINDDENGVDVVGVVNATDDELKDILNSDAEIVFFTPLGLEVGYSYNVDLDGNNYSSWGWVTVTLKNYENWFIYDFEGKTTWDGPVDIALKKSADSQTSEQNSEDITTSEQNSEDAKDDGDEDDEADSDVEVKDVE